MRPPTMAEMWDKLRRERDAGEKRLMDLRQQLAAATFDAEALEIAVADYRDKLAKVTAERDAMCSRLAANLRAQQQDDD